MLLNPICEYMEILKIVLLVNLSTYKLNEVEQISKTEKVTIKKRHLIAVNVPILSLGSR